MYVKIGFIAGTDIEKAAEEALAFSRRLNVAVVFDFNGVECYVNGNETVSQIVADYQRDIRRLHAEQERRYNRVPKNSSVILPTVRPE